MDKRIAILCVGNVLMRDDGLGPRVAEELLACYQFPEKVEVLDRATMGMALMSDFKRFDLMLVVDAVDNTGKPPGTVVTYLPDDIAPQQAFHGAHDTRLADVLQAAALLGYSPDVHCIGVQAQDASPADFSIGLTAPVLSSLPFVIECILGFLEQHGIRPTLRQYEPRRLKVSNFFMGRSSE